MEKFHELDENDRVCLLNSLGETTIAFVILKQEESADENEVVKSINQSVAIEIAKFAVPSAIYCVDNLPKTRSGKVMRRLLRKLATGETDLGDTSTLLDVSVLDHIRNAINKNK